MSYPWLCAALLLIAVGLTVVAWRLRPTDTPRRRSQTLIAIAITLALTAIGDNAMIGNGLVGYDQDTLIGFRVGLAPIEDFAYPVFCVLAGTALWDLCDTRRRTGAQ